VLGDVVFELFIYMDEELDIYWQFILNTAILVLLI